MKTKLVKGVEFSALSLGTVQLGLRYGINNTDGKPDRRTAFEILNRAVGSGVTALDTAAGYGDSEAVIGEWLRTVPEEKRPFVMTKVAHLDCSSYRALEESMRTQVAAAGERLGFSRIPLLLLHRFEEYEEHREWFNRIFAGLKASGEIRFCGVSCYAHHDYGAIAASGLDAVQIPLNLFDWRQIDSGGYGKLVDSGMMIFVRSVYLQGLVFQEPDKLDPRMEFARDTLVKFRGLCEKYRLSPAVLALSYALSVPGVTSLVLGCETPAQAARNAELTNEAVSLSDGQLREIHDLFADTDFRVLTPSEWFNAY